MLTELIRKARLKKNLTQDQVGRRCGYPNGQFVSNWETGKAYPPIGRAKKISKALDIPIEIYRREMIKDYKKQIDTYLN